MPYTLEQLDFVVLHLKVKVPQELLDKKKAAAEEKPLEVEEKKPIEVDEEKQRVIAQKATLQKLVDDFVTPDSLASIAPEIKAELAKATNALEDEAPTPENIQIAQDSIAAVRSLVKQAPLLGALAGRDPEQAKAACQVFMQFASVIGNKGSTPEALEAAKTETKSAREAIAKLEGAKQWMKPRAGEKDEAKKEREAKLQKNEDDTTAARERMRKAVELENALLGQKSLADALQYGPLSAGCSRPLESGALDIVKAYGKNARLADSAVKQMGTAQHPEAIAKKLGEVADMVGGNFQASNGKEMKPEDAQKYGERLLQMGGDTGEEFFTGLTDYISSGMHLDPNPVAVASFNPSVGARAQKRSVALATSFIDPDDGSINLNTPEAKAMIGHVLFHPNTLENPTPAMNVHVLETMKYLQHPDTGPEASQVLQATTKSDNPNAATLVRRATFKKDNDPIGDNDTRVAVLASFLKPFNQGRVGSCFATAPCRRLRAAQPLDAMKAMSEIASTGVYKGIPVITNHPKDDDPLQRSQEFTVATVAARLDGSRQKRELSTSLERGLNLPWGFELNKKKLKNDVLSEFTFIYDPDSKVTNSKDGSSKSGRYVIMRASTGEKITTKEEFIAAMADVAIVSLRLKSKSREAQEIKSVVGSEDFIKAVCPIDEANPDGYKPWELHSGGQSGPSVKVVFGTEINVPILEATTPSDEAMPSESKRITDLVNSFLNTLGSHTDDMVTMSCSGIHGFNALPKHPSLDALKGANAAETAENVRKNLIDKGTALKDTDLSAERAAYLFDQEMNKKIEGAENAELKTLLKNGATANRPTTAMKPAQLTNAIREASLAHNERLAQTRADQWKDEKMAADKSVTDEDLDKKKAENKAALDEEAENEAKALLMRDLGAPEFVIADTNWGDSTGQTLFVIAPDPATGKPRLWKKTVPPGSMAPLERKWLDTVWRQSS